MKEKTNIRIERAKKNITQGQLAEAVGVSRQVIHLLETKKTEPKLPLAIRIAKFFGKPVEIIFEENINI